MPNCPWKGYTNLYFYQQYLEVILYSCQFAIILNKSSRRKWFLKKFSLSLIISEDELLIFEFRGKFLSLLHSVNHGTFLLCMHARLLYIHLSTTHPSPSYLSLPIHSPIIYLYLLMYWFLCISCFIPILLVLHVTILLYFMYNFWLKTFLVKCVFCLYVF